jgi:hypothetical protein
MAINPATVRYHSTMSRFFINQYQQEIETWAVVLPVNKANDSINIGGLDLRRRELDGMMFVAPSTQIDAWHMSLWEGGPVNLDPNPQ